jgi:tetratricopeptide (TPR) repeat protein
VRRQAIVLALIPTLAVIGAKVPVSTRSTEAKTRFVEGRTLAEQLRLHDARQHFTDAVALDPHFALAHYCLATYSATAKEFFTELNLAVANIDHASDGERLMILNLQAAANGNQAKALDYAKQLATKYPQDERALFVLGNAYFARQRFNDAVTTYKRAIAVNSQFSPAYNSLGYAYRPLGDYADAEAAFKKYIELVPDDPNPYDSYGELLMQMGRFDESIAQYRKALAIDPHFFSSHIGIAANEMYQGHTDDALKESSTLYDNARDDGERRQAVFSQVLIYVDAGQTDEALQHMEQEHAIAAAIGDTANMAADRVAMGDILLNADRPDEASTRYAEADAMLQTSSLDPAVKHDNALADMYNRARVALAKHDLTTATRLNADYLAGAEEEHSDFRVRQAHELAGRIALAEEHYDQAISEMARANQQNPYVLYTTGLAYEGSGQLVQAKAFFAKAGNADILPMLQYVFVRKLALAHGSTTAIGSRTTRTATRSPSSANRSGVVTSTSGP